MLDFLGIGAQKAATTWLYANLSRHPHLRFPAGKEVHFWDRHRDRGVEWWLGLFADAPPGVRQGEITPAYAMLEASDIAEIRKRCPDVRLFYSVRNPLERAWSAALMALGRAELEPDEASDAWFVDHFRSRGSLARGDYAGCLRRWSSVFPREQLHVIVFDDIARDPRGVMRRLAVHLGVSGEVYDAIPEADLRAPVHTGPPVPIRPSLIPVLRDLYAPRIDELSEWLGRDLAEWRASLAG